MMHRDEEIRPFFGEPSPPVGGIHRQTPVSRRPSYMGWEGVRQARIEAGLCPLPQCPGELDADRCCQMCGWSLVAEEMRRRLEQQEPAVEIPEPQLPFDEYAEANVDAA